MMSQKLNRHFSRSLLMIGFVLVFFYLGTTAFAQEINPQAVIPGSIQQGTWYEQWDQAGTVYCPNNSQRNITTTSEAFTLTAPSGEETLSITYSSSRISLFLARSSNGTYVSTNERGWWVHLVEVTPVSPTQMIVLSRFYAKDGSCTLSNRATWSFTGTSPQTCTLRPSSVAVNKRSGPGTNYAILGRLLPNTTATVINVGYDTQGTRWWLLSDNTWVSSLHTIVQGNCPS
jgi:hypothetical protein